MKTKILSLFTVLLLVGCYAKFVPVYSPELEKQIVDTYKINDKLYLDMLNEDVKDRTYKKNADKYTNVEAEINSIRIKNEIRDKNTEMIKMIDNIETLFKKYRDEHMKKVTLTDGEIKVYQSFTKGIWLPLLKAEAALKKTKNH